MKFDSRKHHHHSIRVKGYDYTQPGGYFITIVTYHRDLLFGKILNDEMQLNDLGKFAEECWRAIPEHFPNVELGTHIVMPIHVHGIVVISAGRGTIYRAPTQERFQKPVVGSIPTIIRTFKAAVTRRIGREHNGMGIWQRNYYEHIIRNDEDWDRIHRYIEANPSIWADDEENPNKQYETRKDI